MNTPANHRTGSTHRAAQLLCAVAVALLATGGAARAQATPPAAAAVYTGPAPVYGGDPAIGETEDSYFARTGDHLPVSAEYGGEPVPGESDDSYFARTGHHLPGR